MHEDIIFRRNTAFVFTFCELCIVSGYLLLYLKSVDLSLIKIKLKMTIQEITEIAGYLANPKRLTHLEVELPHSMVAKYSSIYTAASGLPFPGAVDPSVYVIPPGGNKWGREMRCYIYITDAASFPASLTGIATIGGRPGYEIYDTRVNNKALIDELIELGFVIGSPQDEIRIRASVDPALIAHFNTGYSMP